MRTSVSIFLNVCEYFCTLMLVSLYVVVFANGPRNRSSIPGRVMPKTKKTVLDAASLNTQLYKVRIKVKVEQSSSPQTPRCYSY